MTTSRVTLFQEESIKRFWQPNILSPRIWKGTRKGKTITSCLRITPTETARKTSATKKRTYTIVYAYCSQNYWMWYHFYCCCLQNIWWAIKYATALGVIKWRSSKKRCCLLQQVHDNGNVDDIRAIKESIMEFLTDTVTARKDRFTEVLQELMKNINKPTRKGENFPWCGEISV